MYTIVVHVHNMTSCVFGFMHLLSALMVASRTSCIANTSIRMYMSLKVPVIGLIWELIDFVCEGQVLLLSVCS